MVVHCRSLYNTLVVKTFISHNPKTGILMPRNAQAQSAEAVDVLTEQTLERSYRFA